MNTMIDAEARNDVQTESSATIRAQLLQFWLHFRWKDNQELQPWDGRITAEDGTMTSKLINKLKLSGTCESGKMLLPDGRERRAVTCKDCDIDVTGDDLIITSSKIPSPDLAQMKSSMVMVRLNTEWLKNSALPEWRILTQLGDGTFKEEFANSFRMTGQCFGWRHNVVEGHRSVPKMHISCFGRVIWNADHVEIWGRV